MSNLWVVLCYEDINKAPFVMGGEYASRSAARERARNELLIDREYSELRGLEPCTYKVAKVVVDKKS